MRQGPWGMRAVAMRFAMKSGQVRFSQRKLLAIVLPIQTMLGCGAMVQWAAKGGGGVQTGGVSRSGLFFPFFSFFVLFGTFPIFPGFSRFARGLFGDFPDSSLFSFSAYEEHLRGTVPKGSATQSGPFPKKVGNPPVWKPPDLASPKMNFQPTHHLASESCFYLCTFVLGVVCPS